MTEFLKDLCSLSGTSGSEKAVRDYIIEKIDGFCEYRVDNLGNILFEKKGEKEPKVRVMLDAHTDEVGIIVTSVTENGFLRFKTVGGIEKESLLFHRVKLGDNFGVIGNCPVHLLKGDAAKKLPETDSMYIDIGAECKSEALKYVLPGDTGVLCGDYYENGDKILSKALDDRLGCAVLISLIREKAEYGFCGSFSSMEEIGCVGAGVAAFSLKPQAAIVLEGTTASDISGTASDSEVCTLGKGVAVSFMDGGTVYDREYYKKAMESGIICQPKRATTGGNDAAAIHKSREGVRTLALSVPSRYIHSSSSVCDKRDIESMEKLVRFMIKEIVNS